MLSKLTTKIALRKAGLGNLSMPTFPKYSGETKTAEKGEQTGTTQSTWDAMLTSWNMEMPKSWGTWSSPPPPVGVISELPAVGTTARSTIGLRFPRADGKPVILMFLRHCGCPFAEKAFVSLRAIAEKHPEIFCVAVSHCSRQATRNWIDVIGGAGQIDLVVDEPRGVYSLWGLGISNTWYLLNPKTQIESAKGTWGREMSGSRWQVGGTWGIDSEGIIKWGGMSKTADEMPALEQCVRAIR